MAKLNFDIMKSFQKEQDVVVIADFIEFWDSLSDEDRERLQSADLKKMMKKF